MGKANSLKDSMKGGLNGLLSPTSIPHEEPRKPAAHHDTASAAAPRHNAQEAAAEAPKKESAVHCNFVINKSIHTRMKYLAIEKNMSLRDIVNEAMSEYLERNGK